MLKILRFLREAKHKLDNNIPGLPGKVKPVELFSEGDVLEQVPRRIIQSKSVRQRRRRNVMKRIYGDSYEHNMDDYK